MLQIVSARAACSNLHAYCSPATASTAEPPRSQHSFSALLSESHVGNARWVGGSVGRAPSQSCQLQPRLSPDSSPPPSSGLVEEGYERNPYRDTESHCCSIVSTPCAPLQAAARYSPSLHSPRYRHDRANKHAPGEWHVCVARNNHAVQQRHKEARGVTHVDSCRQSPSVCTPSRSRSARILRH